MVNNFVKKLGEILEEKELEPPNDKEIEIIKTMLESKKTIKEVGA